MKFPKINLHIHSTYSDGKDTIENIMNSALHFKLDYIAITDHFTNSWKEKFTSLKNNDMIIEYLEEITHFQNYLRDFGQNLVLLKGLEIDLGSTAEFIRKIIQPSHFDLILFEYLEDVSTIAFIKNIINFWKKKVHHIDDFPILGLAHFDPSFFIHHDLDVLVNFLETYSIYFEFNSNYPMYYSRQNEMFFTKLRDNYIPVAIGSDSHSINTINNFKEPLDMIQYYKLDANFEILLEKLKNKYQLRF